MMHSFNPPVIRATHGLSLLVAILLGCFSGCGRLPVWNPRPAVISTVPRAKRLPPLPQSAAETAGRDRLSELKPPPQPPQRLVEMPELDWQPLPPTSTSLNPPLSRPHTPILTEDRWKSELAVLRAAADKQAAETEGRLLALQAVQEADGERLRQLINELRHLSERVELLQHQTVFTRDEIITVQRRLNEQSEVHRATVETVSQTIKEILDELEADIAGRTEHTGEPTAP